MAKEPEDPMTPPSSPSSSTVSPSSDPASIVDFAKAGGLVTAIAQDDAKGEESGNVQNLKGMYVDCDGDALVLRVEQVGGAACHTGKRNCFFRRIDGGQIEDVGVQVFDPAEVYKK